MSPSQHPRGTYRRSSVSKFVRSAFNGRDFFSELEHCQHLFWNLTGESVESFLQIVQDVGPTIYSQTRRRNRRQIDYPYILDMRNRILLVMIWLRMYPEVVVLSGMFMISPTTVQREVRMILPLLWHYFKGQVQWPTHQQWIDMANHWELFPGAVGIIDGTRHEIQRPRIEPQQHFYSGHCRYHNFSTQIIMDNHGNIVFMQSGFLGHNNDSAQFYMMPRIGPGEELHLPHGLYILADKGYPVPEQYPLLTPWREAAIAGRPQRELFNLELRRVRVTIEHFDELRSMTLRTIFGATSVGCSLSELCACLAQRHILLSSVI